MNRLNNTSKNYIIVHVYINKKEGEETKYSVTEYVDPLKENDGLKLSMTRYKELE